MPARAIPTGTQIVPSLLAADFVRLGREIRAVEDAGAEILHLDVMDGHFVPNITFGPPLVRSVRGATRLFLDTHLMIRDPLAFMEPFARAGADLLTLHVETLGGGAASGPSAEGLEVFRRARELASDELGCLLGLSFRPVTDPLPWLRELGASCDLALIMTVEPGFGGQAFRAELLPRIAEARRLIDERGWTCRVEVDGGVDADTAGSCARAGADLLVAGTAVFDRPDRTAAMRELETAIRRT